MADNIVVKLEDVWKSYGLISVLRERWRRLSGIPIEAGKWALQDINFGLERGEMLGIIGRNGAGKSTLLKILAGVSPATKGCISVQGRVFPMIELNAGINPELTGRENVYLLGAIMGLTKTEIRRLMPGIENFCELNSWFEQPIRQYSSGMLARLGFAVAANVKADVLLIDEVLAVGDMGFQKKCIDWLNRVRREGATILFVSHNLNYIERLCSKALYLEKGVVRAFGEVKETCARYYEQMNDEILSRLRTQSGLNPISRDGSREMRIVGAKLLDAAGSETKRVYHQSDLCIRLIIKVYKEIDNPCFTVIIIDQDMNPVGHATTLGNKNLYRNFSPGITVNVDCWLRKLNLLRGIYTIDAGIGDQHGSYRLDVVSNLAQFEVIYSVDNYITVSVGHFVLPADWRIEYCASEGSTDVDG